MGSHRRPEVTTRLARIDGHVHAIQKMAREGKSYAEIVHQISAVRSAFDAVLQVIVEDLVEDCVSRTTNVEASKSMLELKEVIARTR